MKKPTNKNSKNIQAITPMTDKELNAIKGGWGMQYRAKRSE